MDHHSVVKNVSDGDLYIRAAFGGLDVETPFTGLLTLRNLVISGPEVLFAAVEEAEQEGCSA